MNAQRDSIKSSIILLSKEFPDIQLLKSIPGFSEISSAAFISEIGCFEAFNSHKALVAFSGADRRSDDASVKQSGNFVGTKVKMSKRGSKYIRAC